MQTKQTHCALCPRHCPVDRAADERGFCGAPQNPVVAAALPHFWEEPCISGTRGSGAVFFSGCNLACVYCQNHEISRQIRGRSLTPDELRDLFCDLIAKGVHNINLVTPTCYADSIAIALTPKLAVPVVYNCGGYECAETIALLAEKIDVWLPDMKYAHCPQQRTDAATSGRGNIGSVEHINPADKYSHAGDYAEHAAAAILLMADLAGAPQFDGDGLLTRGVIMRHLVLPDQLENTFGVLDWFAENLRGKALLSLMCQFTPNGCDDFPRALRTEEYRRAVDYVHLLGIRGGFTQEPGSAREGFVPDWVQ
ncbi:MAG: radical SAM protein [Oscillospiraceae bacterium]|jgi:putative pyruvate formate lyase activating enzyme|nr:radical SAM protein [Oscillospiraceae bacterium]